MHPLNLLFIGICAIAICFYFRWNRTARAISYAMAIVCIAITTLPSTVPISNRKHSFKTAIKFVAIAPFGANVTRF